METESGEPSCTSVDKSSKIALSRGFVVCSANKSSDSTSKIPALISVANCRKKIMKSFGFKPERKLISVFKKLFNGSTSKTIKSIMPSSAKASFLLVASILPRVTFPSSVFAL